MMESSIWSQFSCWWKNVECWLKNILKTRLLMPKRQVSDNTGQEADKVFFLTVNTKIESDASCLQFTANFRQHNCEQYCMLYDAMKKRPDMSHNYVAQEVFNDKLIIRVSRRENTDNSQLETNREKSSVYFTEMSTNCLPPSKSVLQNILKRNHSKSKNTSNKAHEDSGSTKKKTAKLVVTEPSCENVATITNETNSYNRTNNLHDIEIINIEDEEWEKLFKSLANIKEVSELTDDQLTCLAKHNERYLRNIFTGKNPTHRHELYKSGGKARRELTFSIPMNLYTEKQRELVLKVLTEMFCKRHTKYVDYVLRVMFPEVLIKIHMDIHKLEYKESEQLLYSDNC